MDAAEIDGADADGLSALGWAATLGHAPVCEALLAAGADRAALGDELEGELDALLAEAEAERRAEAEAAAAAPLIDYSHGAGCSSARLQSTSCRRRSRRRLCRRRCC